MLCTNWGCFARIEVALHRLRLQCTDWGCPAQIEVTMYRLSCKKASSTYLLFYLWTVSRKTLHFPSWERSQYLWSNQKYNQFSNCINEAPSPLISHGTFSPKYQLSICLESLILALSFLGHHVNCEATGIASHWFSKNPHIPSFHIQGGERGDAEEVWARLAASQRPQDANIFKGEASRASRACQSEVALFRGSSQGSIGFKFAKLRRRRRKRQDTTATCQLTVIPWNRWIVHECH